MTWFQAFSRNWEYIAVGLHMDIRISKSKFTLSLSKIAENVRLSVNISSIQQLSPSSICGIWCNFSSDVRLVAIVQHYRTRYHLSSLVDYSFPLFSIDFVFYLFYAYHLLIGIWVERGMRTGRRFFSSL